jgi:hypothetical protein
MLHSQIFSLSELCLNRRPHRLRMLPKWWTVRDKGLWGIAAWFKTTVKREKQNRQHSFIVYTKP